MIKIVVCMVIFLLFLGMLLIISTIIGIFTILPEKKETNQVYFCGLKAFGSISNLIMLNYQRH